MINFLLLVKTDSPTPSGHGWSLKTDRVAVGGGAWTSGGVLGRVGVFPRRLTHQLPKILMCSEVFLSARALPSVFLRLLKEWVEKFSVKSRFREIWSCSRE